MAATREAFSELGLTGGESRVLEALISGGAGTGSEIAGRLGVNKSVAYFVLEQLVQKKLASFVVINKRREYRPLEPEVLKARLERRKEDFLKNLEGMSALILAAR